MTTHTQPHMEAQMTDTPDQPAFDLHAWIKGAQPLTRAVEVYGRPDLLGEIETLQARLLEAQSGPLDETREAQRERATDIAKELQAAREAMLRSAQTFRFRGLRNGEIEELREEMGKDDPNPDGISELDYRCMARQCVAPAGLSWENFRDMHTNLGAYFMRTIADTANAAARARRGGALLVRRRRPPRGEWLTPGRVAGWPSPANPFRRRMGASNLGR